MITRYKPESGFVARSGGPDRKRPHDWIVWHFTHADNLPGIITAGRLLADSAVTPTTEVAYNPVKELRRHKVVAPDSRYPASMASDHVPFYIAARSPMLYVVCKGHSGYSGGAGPLVPTVDPLGTHCRILATCPAGSGGSVAAAIVSAVGTQPTGTENHTFNYLDLVRYLAVGNLNPSPLGYVGGSDVFTTITPATAQGIASAVDAFPRGAGRMLAIMHALDGALATVSPGATAFPWRRQSALVQWYVETSGSPSEATSWLNTAHQAVRAYSVGGYVNYLEVNQPPARYFGPNLSRLSAVRQKYDPSRVMFSGLNF